MPFFLGQICILSFGYCFPERLFQSALKEEMTQESAENGNYQSNATKHTALDKVDYKGSINFRFSSSDEAKAGCESPK